ncbi:MAG: DUF362 domain-containing protein [Chitinispirillaceae bacterium]|nr:DUF362 domain-containing protein [Chitinispirillaceae bacterium]
MPSYPSGNRRDFLKTTVFGTAGAMASGMFPDQLTASPFSSASRKIINPAIDNCRVVCCTDPEMVTGNPSQWNTVADQNKFIDVDRVQTNMDRMAMALAQKATSREAWAAIFQKPASKEWSAIKAAIKVNAKTRSGIPKNNPRLAVIDKICKAFNGLGIPFGNIIIYDADDEEASVLYREFIGNGLPDGVVVSRRYDSLGGTVDAPVPAPWNKNAPCVRDIANGTIDILVNCTVNKGSHNWTGPASISMKNHYGTFLVSLNETYHNFDFIVGTNKSEAIVGGTPPRQQLCIVDSIYACTTGPSDPPDKAPHSLVMGTYSPVVDYLIVKKIREKVMGARHTESIINRYLTEFGYLPEDAVDFVYADEVPVDFIRKSGRVPTPDTLTISIRRPSSTAAQVAFSLQGGARPLFIDIRDLQGRHIKTLEFATNTRRALVAAWDGCNEKGRPVEAGNYIVTVMQNGTVQSKSIALVQRR